MEKQGWSKGKGLGKNEDGKVRPVALKRVMSFGDAYDFNHFSSIYTVALNNIGSDPSNTTAAATVTREEIVFAGMFVKAVEKPEDKSPALPIKKIGSELELLEICGNRTARRSVKKLKVNEQEGIMAAEEIEKEPLKAEEQPEEEGKKKKKKKKKEKKKSKKNDKKTKKESR
jgi:hypothetical protein